MRLDPAVLEELQRRLPEVAWRDVRFHRGLPWLARWVGASALVLPCAWHPRRVHVHLGAHDPATEAGWRALLHEATHARQYQDLGSGLGGLRPFVVAYLAWVPWLGWGRRHPLEVPAYGATGEPTPPFWRLVAGEGPARRLLPLRLAAGLAGALAALLVCPLLEPFRRERPPP